MQTAYIKYKQVTTITKFESFTIRNGTARLNVTKTRNILVEKHNNNIIMHIKNNSYKIKSQINLNYN